ILYPPGGGPVARLGSPGRIQDHLQAAGHLCILKDTSDYESPLAISKLISSEKLEAALGIHLFKAGRLLQGSPVPFGIIFGGTDVNEDPKSEEKFQIMEKVLDEARFAVSFTEAMKEAAATYWVGIVSLPNRQHNWAEFLQRAGKNAYKREMSQNFYTSVICEASVLPDVSPVFSVLQAMDLNVLVLARDIPGNAAVIAHQTTGLLYTTPKEFVQLAKTLMKDPVLYREIVRKAHEYVLKYHSWEKERKVYQNLVLRLHECSCTNQP
ncbi:PREDICTED: glycosyltransferase 1 domain-containing protein 1, partial [Thamnophis sirtalis]|uniref:Glycosyltransferase 1 domain-containing protein 1 n=1 Tax=Thamnophis sirtalis TaxID=35019 RepID=A0A6I9XZ23_9SAUR